MPPLVFISYRRDDEGTTSRFIKTELDRVFGAEHIFMDIDNIRKGDRWKEIIEKNINSCNCLIVIIGKRWLQLHDEHYARRLDKKEDWVRREIETCLQRKIKIIPLLMGASLPEQNALPESILGLRDFQYTTLSALTWKDDIDTLAKLLLDEGFVRKETSVEFPDPRGVKDSFPLALTDEELVDLLKGMPGWEITSAPVPGKSPKEMQEITKKFVFKSFEDAMNFMQITACYMSKVQHHPRWENLWKTIIIHLSTWDIGHKVSKLDIELAAFLDQEFQAFSNQADGK
jgi:pterin-4a-carbinolamine dehydratase